MFPATDNPAQRLLEILTRASGVDANTVTKAWEAVFGIKIDPPTFYRIGGYLNGLVDSVEMRIKQIDSLKHDLYLREIPTLRKIVSPTGMNEGWVPLKAPLTTGALTGLEFCANELGKLHQEDSISKDELKGIKSQLTELLAEVMGSQIKPEIKLILSDLLSSSLLAIDQYQILGNDGLKKAVAYAIGTVTLHRDQFISAKSESLVKRSMEVIMTMGRLVANAYKMGELAAPELAKLLGHS